MFEHRPLEVFELNAEMIDGKRFYRVDDDLYPSVTSVLSTLNKDKLNEWVQRVGADEAERIKNLAASRGTKVHAMCEDYVANVDGFMKGKMPDAISLFKQIQPWLDTNIDFVYNIEIPLHSKQLKTAGRCDLIAGVHDLGNCIIDYKTSTKPKQDAWIENYFMQETAYSIMTNEMYGLEIDHIITLIAVETEPTLQVFIRTPNEYKEKTLSVFNQYHVDHNSI